jgi:hypothetical protein
MHHQVGGFVGDDVVAGFLDDIKSGVVEAEVDKGKLSSDPENQTLCGGVQSAGKLEEVR